MKKSIFIIIFLLLILIGLAPWVTGYYFKQNYLQFIANLNQNNKAQITITKYQLGWCHSHVILRIVPFNLEKYRNLDYPLSNGDLTSITLVQDIKHGPIVYDQAKKIPTIAIAAMHQTIHLANKIETFLLGQPKANGIGTIDSVVGFNGNWSNHIQMPLISVTSKKIVNQIVWQGLNGNVDFKVNANSINKMTTDLRIGMLTANSNANTPGLLPIDFKLQSISENAESTLHSTGLWIGHAALTIPAISVKYASKLQFGLEHFLLGGMSNVTPNNLYTVLNHLCIQKIEIPNNVVPSFSDVHANFALNNINANEMTQLINLIKTAQQNNLPTQDRARQYMALFPRLITPSTNFKFDLTFNSTLGPLFIQTNVDWPANTALPKTTNDIVKNITMKTDIRIASGLENVIMDRVLTIAAIRAASRMNMTPMPPLQSQNLVSQRAIQKDIFNKKIAELMQKGELRLTVGVQLMTLFDKQVTPEVFKVNLNQLGVTPPAQAQLIPLYNALMTKATPKPSPAPQIDQAQLQQQMKSVMQKKFDDLVSQGYIQKINNDYVTSITYQGGVIKINGKVLPQQLDKSELRPTPPIQAQPLASPTPQVKVQPTPIPAPKK